MQTSRDSLSRRQLLRAPLHRLEALRSKERFSSAPFYAKRAAKDGEDYWMEFAGSYMLGSPIEDLEECSIPAAEELHRRGLMSAEEVAEILRIATEYEAPRP